MAFITLNYENFVRGDDWTFSYTITDENEQPIDIRGYTFYFTMKAAATDADPGALQISKYLDPDGIYATDAQNGILTLEAGSLNTTNVNAGVYQYDLQQLDENNKVKTLYMGTVTVLPDITRATVGTPPPDAAIINNLEYATVSYVNNLASFSTIDKGELSSLALAFVSDADSGFYGKDDDQWALVAGGVEKVNISTDGIDITGDLTVSGDATISGNLTFGDTNTDTVSFAADINSNFLPDITETYNLGSVSKTWNDAHIGGTAYLANITFNGIAVTADASELNILDGATVSTTELNILDGATVSTTELNILDGATVSTTELNILDGATVSTTELNILDGFTGTVDDLNYAKDLRASGVTAAEFDKIDGLTAEASELNILDGATVTTGEVNTLSGATSNIQNQLNNKQPLDPQLTDIAGLTPTDGHFIVGNGTNFTTESGQTVLTSLGVTATTAELNILDGVTATTAELNILDGVTATTTELNYTDGVTSSIQNQLNNRYTKSETDTQIANVVASAPETLNTLNELANALGDDPNFATTVSNNIGTKVSKAGDTMTGDLDFGDNVKAKFGAGDDLQIYHSGSHSFISDAGTGQLFIDATNLRLRDASANLYLLADSGGEVGLYYNNSEKLATTSTGVDVTGKIEANDFHVTGTDNICGILESTHTDGNARLLFKNEGNASEFNIGYNNNGQFTFYDANTNISPLTIYPSGVINMANGIQTSDITPTTAGTLKVEKSGQNVLIRTVADSNNAAGFDIGTPSDPNKHRIRSVPNSNDLSIFVNSNERMRFRDGKVGINTGDPQQALDVNGRAVFRNHLEVGLNTGGVGLTYNDGGGNANLVFNHTAMVPDQNGNSGRIRVNTDDASNAVMDFQIASSVTGGVSTALSNRYSIGANTHTWYKSESNATEAMRLDLDGVLLIGKSVVSLTNVGHTLFGNGQSNHTVTNGEVSRFNRKGNDGNINIFYKDSLEVGSIGVNNSDIYIASSGAYSAGLMFEGTSGAQDIRPCDKTGALLDAAVDLGASNARFKDLHLSDTIHLAGWDITESNGDLYFAVGGVNKMKLDANGNLQVVGSIESNATIS